MRFIREAVDGVLLPEVFERYLILEQDFVRAAVVSVCRAVATSPDRHAYDGHLRTLHHLIGEQLPGLEQVSVPRVGASASRPELSSSALSEYVAELSIGASYVEIVCCMLPSEVLYARWCATARGKGHDDGLLGDWIDLHTCARYTDQVNYLVAEVDRLDLTTQRLRDLEIWSGMFSTWRLPCTIRVTRRVAVYRGANLAPLDVALPDSPNRIVHSDSLEGPVVVDG
ncbi:MAG: hypothetical protein ACOYO9_02645 [Candidatus Nanopelagicales bacterium]